MSIKLNLNLNSLKCAAFQPFFWLIMLSTLSVFNVQAQTPSTPTITPTPTPTIAPLPIYATVYQTTNLRAGADTRFEIVGQFSRNDRVQVIGRDGDAARWFYVADAQDPTFASGWITSFSVVLEGGLTPLDVPLYLDIEEMSTEGEDVIVVAYGRVNVRTGPAITFDIVGQLDIDAEARATARNNSANDWLYIVHEDGIEGWVAYFTVRVSGDTSALPVLVPDSAGEALISPSFILRSRFNVRLHTQPLLESPDVVVVPFNNRVTLLARNEDASWLYVNFNGLTGWGAAELFSALPEVENIPIFTPTLLEETTQEVSAGTVTPTAEATQDDS